MIVIAGGGLSGISAAYFLQKKGVEVMVLEESSAPGGCIRSETYQDCILENGPNSLLLSSYLSGIIEELDLQNEVLPALPVNKNRYIFKEGKYRKLPSGPVQLFFGNFFSIQTKIKVIRELFRQPGLSGKSDLGAFFEDHFGKEVVEYALNPFVSGIYAGNPSRLLVSETFPSLIRYESENGSLLKGMIKNAGKRKKLVSFKKGLSSLPVRMAEKIPVTYNAMVTGIQKVGKGFKVIYRQKGEEKTIESSACIFSLPAGPAAKILRLQYPEWADRLSAIDYTPMTVVHSLYKRENVRNSLDGFGGLNPRIENRFSAGSIWTSSVFPSRTPVGKFLFTTFVGGELFKEQANQPDDEVKLKVHNELKESFDIQGIPEFQKIFRWLKALPQYDIKVAELRKASQYLEKENIYICSNIFGGVSIEDCIKKGEEVSEKLKNQ